MVILGRILKGRNRRQLQQSYWDMMHQTLSPPIFFPLISLSLLTLFLSNNTYWIFFFCLGLHFKQLQSCRCRVDKALYQMPLLHPFRSACLFTCCYSARPPLHADPARPFFASGQKGGLHLVSTQCRRTNTLGHESLSKNGEFRQSLPISYRCCRDSGCTATWTVIWRPA